MATSVSWGDNELSQIRFLFKLEVSDSIMSLYIFAAAENVDISVFPNLERK